jgi:endonuclease YncB( thermonuclease family)
MDVCCDSIAAEPNARGCANCTERGIAVQLQTVKALLTEVALRRVQQTHYRFCGNPTCETVYFGDAGDQFDIDDIRVPVWQKEPSGERLLCYCFGETESAIRDELVEHGRTEVVARIRAHIAAQRCACDIRNPRGACCLGDVMTAVKRIEGAMLSVKDD